MNVLVKVEEICNIERGHIGYFKDDSLKGYFEYLKEEFGEYIELTRNKLGLQDTRPIDLSPENADILKKEIKNNEKWGQLFVNYILHENDETKMGLGGIYLPWWNEVVANLYNSNLEENEVELGYGHSYTTQLVRKGIINTKEMDPASVSGVLISLDNKIVTGLRGGHNEPDKIMTVPAGSINMSKDPLFDTIEKEIEEETGLKDKDIKSCILNGRIYDNSIAKNSLFIFDIRSILSFDEIKETWKISKDKPEHRELNPVENKPEIIKDYILKTGLLLPPGAGSLLVFGRANFGERWYNDMIDNLKGRYR